MKGRIPVPLELKVLRGSRRRRPVDEDAPLLAAGTPQKPTGLNRIESVYWTSLVRRLAARRTLHPSQGDILMIACSYFWQVQVCRAACRESSSYETRSREGAVVWKEKPEVRLMFQALKGLTACMEQLGLTPASAARAHPLPAPKKKERGGIESYFDNDLNDLPPKPTA